MDQVDFRIIAAFPLFILEILLDLYDKILNKSQVANAWLKTCIIFIPKLDSFETDFPSFLSKKIIGKMRL